MRDRLEKAGAPVAFIQVPTPGEHPAQDVLNAVFLILGAIGVLSLAVSGFLVINTISAIISQQTRQIGMMKAVGARDRQVAGVYLGIVLGYALVALVVALPMGALGAWQLTQFTAGLAQLRGDRVLPAARRCWRSRSRSGSWCRSPPAPGPCTAACA